jgi:hypothetical protein
MKTQADITTLEDVKLLVDTFLWSRAKIISLVPYSTQNRYNWPDHLGKMYRFGKLFYWKSTPTLEVFSSPETFTS